MEMSTNYLEEKKILSGRAAEMAQNDLSFKKQEKMLQVERKGTFSLGGRQQDGQ